MTGRFIPPHGGYEDLLSFQKARIVYDGTVWVCKHFLEKRDRTNDQMVQAARSGKQNILEGSQASGTSKATEIKLTNVAKEHCYAMRLRQLNRQPQVNYGTFRKGIENSDPAIAANVMIGLIKLTNYLLDQQIRQLEKAFLEDGGLRERMTRARLNERDKQSRRRFGFSLTRGPNRTRKATYDPSRDLLIGYCSVNTHT